jgi:hypothetical protein
MKRKPNSKTLFWGEIGCGVMMVVFWEVGGGYGGVAAEEVGGDYGEKKRDVGMRGEREFLSVFSFIFNKVFFSLLPTHGKRQLRLPL